MAVKLRKAIFPVAGFGTRFLPVTKANPKEMLPIVDKPLIQYAVEEALSAGIEVLIFVTNTGKRAIEDHFDSNKELERLLELRGKDELLSSVRNIIPDGVTCVYIRQSEPIGLGHAVLCAADVVGDEPCAVLLADELIASAGSTSCLRALVSVYEQTQSSVVAVQRVPRSEIHKYGIVGLRDDGSMLKEVTCIVEKPEVKQAPSDYAAVGRYILSPAIFRCLNSVDFGAGGELQLTDAMSKLLKDEKMYAHELNGERYDCGSKLGYLQATVQYALRHPEVGAAFANYLKQITGSELAYCKTL